MPTPNYGYEKRQRELAKKQKKEEKLRAKAERRSGQPGEDEEPVATPKPVPGESPPPVSGSSA